MGLVKIENGENQSQLQFGDIIFTTSSETPDEIGMTSVFLEEEWFPYLNSFCFGLRSHDFHRLAPQFGKHLFRGDAFRLAIKPLAQGSTRFNLSKGNLKKLTVTLPPLPEQKKIASILTSVDEVIEKTQSQIDKLQDLKKGTMNELLSKGIGHTEFKKIDGWHTGKIEGLEIVPSEWRLVNINDVSKLESGHTPSRNNPSYWNGYIGWLSLHDTKTMDNYEKSETALMVTQAGIENSSARILPKNTVALSRTATVGNCVLLGREMATSQDFANFVCGEELHPLFLMLMFRHMQNTWKSLSGGSTHETIYMPIFKKLQILLPPIMEQVKMSDVIVGIDYQIGTKKKKLHQTQSLKKSLMQDLLTGKVRVSVN